MSDITSALTAPTHLGFSGGGVLAPGMSGLGSGAGISESMADILPELGGPSARAKYVIGGTDFYDGNVQFTNGFSTHHLSQDVSEWVDGDTGPGQVTFALRPTPSKLANCPPGLGGMRPNDISYKMFGLSMLNFMLKTEWINQFTDELSGAVVNSHFSYLGVQQSKQTLLKSFSTWNEENNFIILGRATIPDIWLAQRSGRPVGETDYLWLVWRRHVVDPSDPASEQVWKPAAPASKKRALSTGGSGYLAQSKRFRGADDEDALESFMDDEDALKEETDIDLPHLDDEEAVPCAEAVPPRAISVDDDERTGTLFDPKELVYTPAEKRKFYWSLDPYVAHGQEGVPMHVLCGTEPDNRFVGHAISVGTITHVRRGANEPNGSQSAKAVRALYPTSRGKAYHADLFTLDEITVMLRQ